MKKLIKKETILKSVFSLFFSLMLVLDTKLICTEKINVFSEVTFAPFVLKDIFILILYFILSYGVVTLIEKAYHYLNRKRNQNYKKIPFIFLISFGVLFLSWLPYFLSYFPGGIYSDTYASIAQLSNFRENGIGLLSNNNPILYTVLLKICISLGSRIFHNGLTGGILFFGIIQYMGCALILSYTLYVIHKKDLPKSITIFSLCFFAFFPLVPLYVISIWKDTPFSFWLILYVAFIFDKVASSKNEFQSKKNIIWYCILSFFVCFLRNNGFFLVIGSTIVLLTYQQKIKTLSKYFVISIVSVLLSVMVIQGPVYSYFHLNETNFIESVSILFQQISYSVKKETELNEKEEEFLNQIIPIEDLKEATRPLNFDTTKWNENFNTSFLNSHKIEFFKLWISLFPRNLKNYTEAYLLQTLGYWDIKQSSFVAYIQTYTWPTHASAIEQKDVLYNSINFSLRGWIDALKPMSSAIFIWIFFFSFTITCLHKKYTFLLIYLPGLFLWLPIMLGVPIAFSLRYVYLFVLLVPFDFIIPLLPYQNKDKR